jgi:hypothetical protein
VKHALVAIALFASTADAQPKKRATESVEKPLVFIPFEAPKRPSMTLAAGTVQLQTTLEMADQTSIAPDISIGMSDELTLSFITSSSAMSGFRGSAGSGICISDGCERRLVDMFALIGGATCTAASTFADGAAGAGLGTLVPKAYGKGVELYGNIDGANTLANLVSFEGYTKTGTKSCLAIDGGGADGGSTGCVIGSWIVS